MQASMQVGACLKRPYQFFCRKAIGARPMKSIGACRSLLGVKKRMRLLSSQDGVIARQAEGAQADSTSDAFSIIHGFIPVRSSMRWKIADTSPVTSLASWMRSIDGKGGAP